MQKIGAPKFTDTEMAFARRLQEPLVAQFGRQFPLAIDDRIHRVAAIPRASKGSTDVGDISWRVPTGGLRTACLPAESPGHSWQNVASIGSSIGEKGIIYSSKILAVTAIELMQRRELIAAARSDWQTRMKDKKYFSFIPDGQQPPKKIR
jgi:aminobenzoyl-glutamate utilization protein B